MSFENLSNAHRVFPLRNERGHLMYPTLRNEAWMDSNQHVLVVRVFNTMMSEWKGSRGPDDIPFFYLFTRVIPQDSETGEPLPLEVLRPTTSD